MRMKRYRKFFFLNKQTILYSRFRRPPRLPSIKIGTDIIKPTK